MGFFWISLQKFYILYRYSIFAFTSLHLCLALGNIVFWLVADLRTWPHTPQAYSSRIMCGFLNVPQLFTNKGCEMGSPVYSPYPRRLKSLTICWCNYKGSTFYSVILRPGVLVQLESNTQPPAWQPDTQPTEPPVPIKQINFPKVKWNAWEYDSFSLRSLIHVY